jgi:hypothetical protein
MIALPHWTKTKVHHEPESLLCLGLLAMFAVVCGVMAWRASPRG